MADTSAPFDTERVREDAEQAREACRRQTDESTALEQDGYDGLSHRIQHSADLMNRLAGYAEEMARVREGLTTLRDYCTTNGPHATSRAARTVHCWIEAELTALLGEGQDAGKEAPDV